MGEDPGPQAMHDLLPDAGSDPRRDEVQTPAREGDKEQPADGQRQQVGVVLRQGLVDDQLEEEGSSQGNQRRSDRQEDDLGHTEPER